VYFRYDQRKGRGDPPLQKSAAMSDGSKDTEYKFKRWKPTIWDYVCKFILSEAFAVRDNDACWGLTG